MNIIGEIQKNQKEKIIISTNEYKGHKYVDLRVHYEDETSGDYKPTKKGIAVNPKILPEVVEMMVQAAESLQGVIVTKNFNRFAKMVILIYDYDKCGHIVMINE